MSITQARRTGAFSARVLRRVFAVAIAVALAVAGSFALFAREHIAALDAIAYPDPTLTFSLSRAAASGGSVIEIDGAPAYAFVEFSGDGVRAYSPTFIDETGVVAVVPPLFRANDLGSGDVSLRLLAPRGPIWTSSAMAPFKIEAPDATGAPPGIATLFALYVTHGLVTNAADAASTAADAGAATPVTEYAALLTERRLEVERLSQRFELVAWGNSSRVAWSGLTIDPPAIRLMDQLTGQYFVSLGKAVSSPCGEAKDAHATAGLSAQSAEAAKAAAARFVLTIVDCEPRQVRDIAARTRMWLSALAYTTAEALRTSPHVPELAALLQLAVVSWSDEAIGATYLWKQYGHLDELRAYMLERSAGPILPTLIRHDAGQESSLSEQIELIEMRYSFENRLLASILEQDSPSQARVAAALGARLPVVATPSPAPVLPMPIFQQEILCGTLTEYRPPTPTEPGAIAIAGERFSIATDARQDIGPRARVGNEVCMDGTWVPTERHGRSFIEIKLR